MADHDIPDSQRDRKPARRRRNYLVNPMFQLRFALMLALGGFLTASCMGMLMFGFLHQQARARVIDPLSPSLWSSGSLIVFFALAFSAVIAVALVIWGIFVSHRISGPLFFLGKNLRLLGAGKFPVRRSLRKKDEFKDLFELFFKTCDDLKSRKESELATVEKLLGDVKVVRTDSPKTIEATLKGVVADLQSLRDDLAGALGREVQTPWAQSVDTADADAKDTQTCLTGE
ncbi:MAG: hypothetical protein ACE5E5_07500 [Phycisphaerae bacterium]